MYGDRREVREAHFIAALTASRRIPNLVAMRARLRQRGMAPKPSRIAVARQLNAMQRNGAPISA